MVHLNQHIFACLVQVIKKLLSKVCKQKLGRIQYQTNFNYYLYNNCRRSLCLTGNIVWTL